MKHTQNILASHPLTQTDYLQEALMKWEYAVIKFAENKDSGAMEVIRLNGSWMEGDAGRTEFEGAFPDFYAYLHRAGQAGWEVVNFVKTDENKTFWYGHLIMKRPVD